LGVYLLQQLVHLLLEVVYILLHAVNLLLRFLLGLLANHPASRRGHHEHYHGQYS
jgi:hypothetical protein